MTAMYHRRFFFDVNVASVLTVSLLLVGWWGIPEAFLLIPVVVLVGAVQTAFDASYLVFARSYAARLEAFINEAAETDILVAAKMEDAYLFPLGQRKVVTVPLGGGFSWFSFVTMFYTMLGMGSFGFGLALGWQSLRDGPPGLATVYLVTVFGLAIAALATGLWWFVGGEGERRLDEVLDGAFGPFDGD